MSRYVINILASQDLNQIADYFAETNIEAGEQFFSDFNRKCKQLVAFPNSSKRYEEIRPDLRGLRLGDHILFYRVLEDGVEILRVVSDRRNLPPLFGASD
jgi:toxin ParE1/3/4